jgi:hypothetical protein
MNRTRPTVVILSTGNASADTLLQEAQQHMALAEDHFARGVLAQDAGTYGIASVLFNRAIVEQNAAQLCLQNARLILDNIPARPGVPLKMAIAAYQAAGFMGGGT